MGVIKRQGIKQSFITYIGVIIGFVNLIYIFPRFLEVEELGLFRFLIDISMLLFPFISLGVHNLSVRMFPIFKDEKNNHNGLLFFLLAGISVGFCLFVVGAVIFRTIVEQHLQTKSFLIQEYWFYLVPLAGFTIFSSILTQWLINFKRIAIPAIFNDLYLKIGLPVIAIIYCFRRISLDQAVMGLVGIFLIRSLSLIFYTVYLGQWTIKPNFSFFTTAIKKEMFSYSLYGLLGGLGGIFANRIDVLMITALAANDLKDVGIYTTAFLIINVMTVPARAIYNISSPVIAESNKIGDLDNIRTIYKKSSIILLSFGILFLIGVWASIDDLFKLMPKGEIFATGKYVILILGIGKLIDLATGVNSQIIGYSKYFRFNFYAVLILAVVNVCANFILIQKYQINGAALATTFSLIIFNVSKLWYINKKMNIQPFSISSLKLLIIGVVVFLIGTSIPPYGHIFLDIVVRSIIITFLYVGSVYYLKISADINEIIDQVLVKITKFI